MEEFSAESLKLKPEHLKSLRPVEKPVARKRQTREFIQITREHSDRLNKAKCKQTENVFRHIMFLSWRTPGKTIRLGNVALAQIGVTRQEKRRALLELKKLDL